MPMQVIGVVKDFHFESMHETIKPSYILLQPHGGKIMARISEAHQKETIAAIQHLYESYNPGFPFTFNFLDEAYQKQYDSETRVSVLSKYFAGLAIHHFLSWAYLDWLLSRRKKEEKKSVSEK